MAVTRSATWAIVSETRFTRASSAGERKNGRKKGQWTRRPNVSLAPRSLPTKVFGNPGEASSRGRKDRSHCFTGLCASRDFAFLLFIVPEILREQPVRQRLCLRHR